MMDDSKKPIGIFDSGIGGLTVARAVVDQLPHEDIIFFGDTAHLPYGDKSAETIQTYAAKIADMLLQQHCKVILIACNSASAAAYDLLQRTVGQQTFVVNVIDPTVNFICENFQDCHMGLIGTRQTVNSKVYSKKIQGYRKNITLHSLATPLFVPVLEEGFADHKIVNHLIEEYLSHPTLKNIDALILGCTHYPIIKDRVLHFYKNKMNVVDSEHIVASFVKQLLEEHHLLNDQEKGSKHFYVSDLTETFAANARRFFDQDIALEYYPLEL